MAEFLTTQMDYIHFFYALTLLILANACLAGKDLLKQRVPFAWLGGFAGAFSVYELLELLAGSLGDSTLFAAVRALILAGSFISLIEFARMTTSRITDRAPARWVLLPLIAMAVLGGLSGIRGFVAASDLCLGLVGGMWGGFALLYYSRSHKGGAGRWMASAGVSLLILSVSLLLTTPEWAPFPVAGLHGIPQIVQGIPVLWLAVSVTYFCKADSASDISSGRHSLVPAAVVLAIFLIGWFLTNLVGAYAEDSARKSLVTRTLTSVAALEPEDVEKLTGTVEDKAKPWFKHIRQQLVAIHRQNKDCRFVYLMRIQDGKMIFLADAEPEDSKDYSPPGQVYEDATPGDFDDYRSGYALVKPPYTDSWGTWVSGLSPITTRDGGRIIAQLGMDVDAAGWIRSIGIYRLFVIVVAHFMCLMVLLLFIAWRRARESAASAAALVERKNMEQERADFSTMVTTDIRSPLSAIYGYTDILLTDLKDSISGEAAGVCSEIQDNCKRLVNMIDDFTTLSRLEYGAVSLDKSLMDVKKVVKEAVSDTVSVSGKGIKFDEAVQEDMPMLVLDKFQTLRAVTNLLQNAVDQSPSGGLVTLSAGVEGSGEGKFLVVSVSDAGKPIPPSDRDKVFDKFHTRQVGMVKHTGVGLAIVKAIAVAHGGRVELESAVDKGNTFTLYLPAGLNERS